jgi:hypothetical protein
LEYAPYDIWDGDHIPITMINIKAKKDIDNRFLCVKPI